MILETIGFLFLVSKNPCDQAPRQLVQTQRNDERSNAILSHEIRRRYPDGWLELGLSAADLFVALEESSLALQPKDRNFPWEGLRFILSQLMTPDFKSTLEQIQNPRFGDSQIGKLKFKNPFFRFGSKQLQTLAQSIENLLVSIDEGRNPITKEDLAKAFVGIKGILNSTQGS